MAPQFCPKLNEKKNIQSFLTTIKNFSWKISGIFWDRHYPLGTSNKKWAIISNLESMHETKFHQISMKLQTCVEMAKGGLTTCKILGHAHFQFGCSSLAAIGSRSSNCGATWQSQYLPPFSIILCISDKTTEAIISVPARIRYVLGRKSQIELGLCRYFKLVSVFSILV